MLKSAVCEPSTPLWPATEMPSEAGAGRTAETVAPEISFWTCKSWPDARYYLALPETVSEDTPVLVAVHGISRNAREHAEAFAKHCNDLGWVVVAPLFTPNRFPGFQRLGFGKKRAQPRSDLALNAILDEVAAQTGARTGRVYMFGFSAGGQFVHRYTLTHPRRVMAAALGAPGWYTFPDQKAPYPRGLSIDADEAGYGLDLERSLRVPMAVFVGKHDTARDVSLNTRRKIDDQQGRTRPERGRRWIAAIRAAARFRDHDTLYEYCELDGCGHSFNDCISHGQLDFRALEFLICAGMPSGMPVGCSGERDAPWIPCQI